MEQGYRKRRRHTADGYDYGSNGAYFVTVVTELSKDLFGKIEPKSAIKELHLPCNPTAESSCEHQPLFGLAPSPLGTVVIKCWLDIPKHYPFVQLDYFVVMPDHLHGILWIEKTWSSPWKPNAFGPQSQNLAAIIRGFKIGVTKHARQNGIAFQWKESFLGLILFKRRDLINTRNYICRNPENWFFNKNTDC